MGKLIFSFLFCFMLANTAHAEYECATNPNAEGCNPTVSLAQAQAEFNLLAQDMKSVDLQLSREQSQIYVQAARQEMAEARKLMSEGKATEAAAMMTKAKGSMKEAIDAQKKLDAAAAEGVESPCAPEENKAKKTCMVVDPYAKAQLDGVLAQATAMMSNSGSEKTCKAAKMVQVAAMGLNLTHAGMCEAAVSSCRSTCRTAISDRKGTTDPKAEKEAKLANESLNSCRELESRVIASGMSALNNMMAMASSAKCQSALTTNTGGTPVPMDCSNPAMASMPSCVCAANPADPVCTASNGGLGDGGFSSVGNGSGAVDGGKDPEMFGYDDELPQLAASGAGAGAGAQGSSGGGGGMNGGGGAGALPPEEMGGGSGGGPYNTDVMGGLTGGGGAGGSSFGRGGSGESSSGGGLLDGLAAKFNLKGFLPSKADFKNRGLASGMKADGITGPNGPSLFEKVSSRYLKKQSEFLP